MKKIANIAKWLAFVGSIAILLKRLIVKYERKISDKQRMADKHLLMFLTMNDWVALHQNGESVYGILKQNGYQSVAIYGMSYMGETLYNELKNTDIDVKYGIDQMNNGLGLGIKVIKPSDLLPDVDAVIVTPISSFVDIEKMLMEKTNADIISLDALVCDALGESEQKKGKRDKE